MSLERLLQFVLVPAYHKYLQSAQEGCAISNATSRAAATRLSLILIQTSKIGQFVKCLASPVARGAVTVERYPSCSCWHGLTESPDQWAQAASCWFAAQGERLEPTILSGLVSRALDMGSKVPAARARAKLTFLQ